MSNWDVFTHSQGWSHKSNANGDVADNHYHLYSEDIEIMHSLGVNAYRFSISWSRILPSKSGEVNPIAVEFYDKIINTLLLKGIEPFVNINHFDYPQELEDIYGSWLNPHMQDDFVYFAETCFKKFGDRVKYWMTLNEPNMVTLFSYTKGEWPPNRCSHPFGNCAFGNSQTEPLIVMHNMLLAHAKTVNLYRRTFQKNQDGVIGMTVSAKMYRPMRDEDEHDDQAANRALAFDLAWVYDPLIFGDYPPEMRKYHMEELPEFSSEEKLLVKGSIDFIGITHYSTLYAKDCIFSPCPNGNTSIEGFTFISGYNIDGLPIGEPTAMSRFFVVPRGMEEIIEYIKERYNNSKPIFVLENGYAQSLENTNVEDSIEDVKRVEFHKEYLASLAIAIRNGADVRGYFVWSLMDNFEWANEYTVGFGLYYVNRQTLERIPRLSAKWYRDFLTNDTRIKFNHNQMDRLEFPLRK